MGTPELERRRLDAAHDQAVARLQYDAAVAEAHAAGRDPDTDLAVQRLETLISRSEEAYRTAERAHRQALERAALE
jgi:hypothetical protein